ncbi:MAG TPA: CPBP family intramembrane glutamic endopeptidase [Gemmatimonadales bacterium]|nr:CPBP family intramembrane glutamic endopeptidase [Gemmatimonadales bacterium]
MTWTLLIGVDVVLVVLVGREVRSFVGRYRRLTRELVTGDAGARTRLYRHALAFCEEVVFRGWLLATLHGPVDLAGTALIVGAALGFGFAHAYQGPAGVVLATLAGILFCALYVMSGSLLLPILLHVAVDARFAVLPAPSGSALGDAHAFPGSLRACTL